MSKAVSTQHTGFEAPAAAVASVGRGVFALAMVALGVETLVCARYVTHTLGPSYDVIPVIPWLPAVPWIAYLFGVIWVICGAALLSRRTLQPAAMVLGTLLFLCAVFLEAPKNAVNLRDVALRTIVFEPLSLACLAWLLPEWKTLPGWLVRASRYLLGLSLVIFGVDHFLALAFIATLVPGWIPWHVFWVAFFGIVFIAGGVSIALNILRRWGAAGVGLMLGIWVFTLHVPRVLGLYGIPGAPHDPDEWSSLLIAVGLWGGLWAMVREP